MEGKVYIGTSGWTYRHWEGLFYPEGLPSRERLSYFSSRFDTTEINYSFYHLPRPKTYENWYERTPEGFVFAVKVSRLITHNKKLIEVEGLWENFLENALHLKEKLGPFLLQFPPSFRLTEETAERLEEFLSLTGRAGVMLAAEFRHRSWLGEEAWNLLKKHETAWVIADSSRYPKAKALTAGFVYVRMHGPERLFASKYSTRELEELAGDIRGWIKEGRDVYVYFNNDFEGFALENARELRELVV